MGGFDFEWKGKVYDIPTNGGVPFPSSDEAAQALEEWRESPQGIRVFGPLPMDWSKEHYLDDRIHDSEYESDDEYEYYEKCRYGCYRKFYVTSKTHACSHCYVVSCQKCAQGSFAKCITEGCSGWICSNCCEKNTKCADCSYVEKGESEEGMEDSKEDEVDELDNNCDKKRRAQETNEEGPNAKKEKIEDVDYIFVYDTAHHPIPRRS